MLSFPTTNPVQRLIAAIWAAATLVFISSAAMAAVVVSWRATQNMSCYGGVCAPTAKNSVLNVGDLEALLASGNVRVTTTGSAVQAKDLRFDAKLAWSGASVLEVDAYRSIVIQKKVSVTGAGGLTIVTNDGGTGGTFSFAPKGKVTFENLDSRLAIDGQSYTLVNSLPTLASAVAGNPSGAFALANNYDASQDGTYSQCPIAGTLEGVIEGLGNTISHLSISVKDQSNSFSAMVEAVDTPGVIENLRLTEVTVQDSGDDAGIAGLTAVNDGYLFGDSVTGTISGTSETSGAAGLATSSDGTIVSSWANVHATGGGDGGAAGLVVVNDGTIELSHAAGEIEGAVAGGLVGLNEGTISQSYATASVSGGAIGGLVSTNETDVGPGIIENSYATGNIHGPGGGLLYAQGGDEISSSYATGAIPRGQGGFLCDVGDEKVSDGYWDTTTSHTTDGVCGGNISNITGLTTKQLKKRLPPGFDKTIWAEDRHINDGFPYLISNTPVK